MTEAELVNKIRKLRQIKPSSDWVALTKSQILGEEPKVLFFPFFKPAKAGLISVLILFGLFAFSQNSLPGDFLYPIKKITEKSQAVFVPEAEKPKVQLELTNKRLEELAEIAETNQVRKLPAAVEEYQTNVSEAAKSLEKIKEPEKAKEVVVEIKKLEENKQKVEKVLATKIDSEKEGDSVQGLYKTPAEVLIEDLEKRTLSEEDQKILEEAKELYQAGKYSEALEKIWILSQNK
ncbi:MAG: DUF5667 domain-containing protein [Patescibacteria group bacterium]|nr:DUF5667 domain-containing protein [Patescibacteria group bacterium]